jgi:hypothetical protein
VKKRIFLKFVVLVFLLSCPGFLFALSNFNGNTEMWFRGGIDSHEPLAAAALPSADTATQLKFDGALFFDGQIDFWKVASAKFSFSALGEDIVPFGITKEKTTDVTGAVGQDAQGNAVATVTKTNPVSFTLEEVSLTFHLRRDIWHWYISLFAGEFESPGTDVFLQKYFGADPVSSVFMQRRIYQKGTPLYAIDGLGLGIAWRFGPPFAISLYASVPADLNFLTNDTSRLASIDLRFAGAFTKCIFDITAGGALPNAAAAANVAAANPAAAPAPGFALNLGASFLFGNPTANSTLLQIGLRGWDPAATQTDATGQTMPFDFDTIYFLLEPRFTGGTMNFSLALFVLPKNSAVDNRKSSLSVFDNLLYIQGGSLNADGSASTGTSLGGGISGYKNIRMGNITGKAGAMIAGGLMQHLSKVLVPDPAQPAQFSVRIAPFISADLFNGIFNFMLKVDIPNNVSVPTFTQPAGNPLAPQSDIVGSLKIQLSYLVRF